MTWFSTYGQIQVWPTTLKLKKRMRSQSCLGQWWCHFQTEKSSEGTTYGKEMPIIEHQYIIFFFHFNGSKMMDFKFIVSCPELLKQFLWLKLAIVFFCLFVFFVSAILGTRLRACVLQRPAEVSWTWKNYYL